MERLSKRMQVKTTAWTGYAERLQSMLAIITMGTSEFAGPTIIYASFHS